MLIGDQPGVTGPGNAARPGTDQAIEPAEHRYHQVLYVHAVDGLLILTQQVQNAYKKMVA